MRRLILNFAASAALAVLALGPAAAQQKSGGDPAPSFIDQEGNFRTGFDQTAGLTADGRRVVVTGHLTPCQQGEQRAEVQVSVLQDFSLAAARGLGRVDCAAERFAVAAEVPEGRNILQPGPALVCGQAVWRQGQHVTDTRFWCTYVELVTRHAGN